MSVKLCCVFLSAVAINSVSGAASFVCPESKKLYPGDCHLFYKCVPLPLPPPSLPTSTAAEEDSHMAQAYVWVPSRCTAGLVYSPRLKTCVLPRAGWECGAENSVENSLKSSSSSENAMEMTDYSTPQPLVSSTGSSSSILEEEETASSLPLSAVNIAPLDPIKAQMQRLTQLINSLKATNEAPALVPVGYSALDLSFPLKAEKPHFSAHGPNLLPAQIYKITAQLIAQEATPIPMKTLQEAAVDLDATQFDSADADFNENSLITTEVEPQQQQQQIYPDQLVHQLFRKYLANATNKSGEFVKNYTPVKRKTVYKYNKIQYCNTGDRLIDSEDCKKYYICKDSSSLISFTCPPKFAFNAKRKICEVSEYKKCIINQNLNVFDMDIIMESNCKKEGRITDPTSRFSYIVCIRKDDGWIEHKVKCPGNLEYCVQKKICLPKTYCH